jgi:hypothetical protein
MKANTSYHLVHANLATARGSFDDPIMEGFVDRIDEIDSLAQSWPGFVAQPALPDEGLFYPEPFLLNVSVWESMESLRQFTYTGQHAAMLKQREEWFLQSDRPAYVLYWSLVSVAPSEKEIKDRIEHLQLHGSTPYAFTFAEPYTIEEMLEFVADDRYLGEP